MVNRYFTAFSLILIVTVDSVTQSTQSEEPFADKSHYLIDSLVLEDLTVDDRKLLDSALALYHQAVQDTDKLAALGIMCKGMVHKSWQKYQFIYYYMLNDLIQIEEKGGVKDSVLYSNYQFYLAAASNNMAVIYKHRGDIPKALEFFHKGLKIYEKAKHRGGTGRALNNIGLIYKQQDELDKALEYLHKSLEIREALGDKEGIAESMINLGYVYQFQGDLDKALEYDHKCLKLYEELGYKRGMASALNNMATIYQNQGDTSNALESFYKSLKMYEETGNNRGVYISLSNIGNIKMAQMALAEALLHGNRGLAIAREMGFPSLISRNANLLSNVARKLGKYKEALEMYELYIIMRDSIKNEETQKATIRQQTKYEFEKAQLIKEQEEKERARLLAEETSRRDNLQYSVIIIIIVVLFLGLLAVRPLQAVRPLVAEGLIFFVFLIFFEFILVLADPYIDNWSGGAPGIKLLFNAGIAALIFPLHSLFEAKLKGRLVKRG